MKTIVFSIYPAASHLNASFLLAKKLEKMGYRIVYYCLLDAKNTIEKNGFLFEALSENIYPKDYRIKRQGSACLKNIQSNQKNKNFSLWRIFRKIYYHHLEKSAKLMEMKQFLGGAVLKKFLNQYHPDVAIVDNYIPHYVMYYQAHHISVISINTMLCMHHSIQSPPLNSNYIVKPDHPVINKMLSKTAWAVYRLKKQFSNIMGISWCQHEYFIIKKLQQSQKSKCDIIKTSYLRPTIAGIPEIIMTPMSFDFPRNYPKYCHFFYDRPKNISPDSSRNHFHTNGKKLIYCSLGSYAHLCRQAYKIYHSVIKAFGNDKNFVVILSTGLRLKLPQVHPWPKNIYLFRWVKQRDILTQASIMITHAGLNSVKECIETHTPMLAIPFANDGFGNAARVVFHQLGIRLHPYCATPKKIRKIVNILLNYPIYKQAIMNMSVKFEKEKTSIQFSNWIASYLNENRV
jgi:zeaxanthin glucosyltransferase